MRRVLVIGFLVWSVAYARAETIAMLPLDGEKRLEIYGQPVAAEIARAIKAAGFDVVLVGAKMEVPDRAQLIVDGSIVGKGNAITLSIRIRNPKDGTVLETLPAPTTPLKNIDQAAAELSSRVVPRVQAHLAELAKVVVVQQPVVEGKPPVTAPAVSQPLVVASAWSKPGKPKLEPLARALGEDIPGWAREQRREAKLVEHKQLERDQAVKTVGELGTDAGISMEVITFTSETKDGIPMARARVRVRIADRSKVVFDRIVRTDTIVGDKNMTGDILATRVARDVLAIVRPHMRRSVASWR